MKTSVLIFSLALCQHLQSTEAYINMTDLGHKLMTLDQNNVAGQINLRPNTNLLLNSQKAISGPTINPLRQLYQSHGSNSGHVNNFLNAVMATPVMAYCFQYLANNGVKFPNQNAFKNELRRLWFTPPQYGVSGFVHVFMGEIAVGQGGNIVKGFHSWVYYEQQQSLNNISFRGFLKQKNIGKGTVASLRFHWNNAYKSYGSMFIGTSPEFDMALYTACFLLAKMQADNCSTTIGGQEVYISVYNRQTYIRSAFPVI